MVVSGDLTLGGASKLTVDLSAVGNSDASESFWTVQHAWTIVEGTSNMGGESFAEIVGGTFAAGVFSTSLGSGDAAGDVLLLYSPIPKPSTLALMVGLAMVGFVRRRR